MGKTGEERDSKSSTEERIPSEEGEVKAGVEGDVDMPGEEKEGGATPAPAEIDLDRVQRERKKEEEEEEVVEILGRDNNGGKEPEKDEAGNGNLGGGDETRANRPPSGAEDDAVETYEEGKICNDSDGEILRTSDQEDELAEEKVQIPLQPAAGEQEGKVRIGSSAEGDVRECSEEEEDQYPPRAERKEFGDGFPSKGQQNYKDTGSDMTRNSGENPGYVRAPTRPEDYNGPTCEAEMKDSQTKQETAAGGLGGQGGEDIIVPPGKLGGANSKSEEVQQHFGTHIKEDEVAEKPSKEDGVEVNRERRGKRGEDGRKLFAQEEAPSSASKAETTTGAKGEKLRETNHPLTPLAATASSLPPSSSKAEIPKGTTGAPGEKGDQRGGGGLNEKWDVLPAEQRRREMQQKGGEVVPKVQISSVEGISTARASEACHSREEEGDDDDDVIALQQRPGEDKGGGVDIEKNSNNGAEERSGKDEYLSGRQIKKQGQTEEMNSASSLQKEILLPKDQEEKEEKQVSAKGLDFKRTEERVDTQGKKQTDEKSPPLVSSGEERKQDVEEEPQQIPSRHPQVGNGETEHSEKGCTLESHCKTETRSMRTETEQQHKEIEEKTKSAFSTGSEVKTETLVELNSSKQQQGQQQQPPTSPGDKAQTKPHNERSRSKKEGTTEGTTNYASKSTQKERKEHSPPTQTIPGEKVRHQQQEKPIEEPQDESQHRLSGIHEEPTREQDQFRQQEDKELKQELQPPRHEQTIASKDHNLEQFQEEPKATKAKKRDAVTERKPETKQQVSVAEPGEAHMAQQQKTQKVKPPRNEQQGTTAPSPQQQKAAKSQLHQGQTETIQQQSPVVRAEPPRPAEQKEASKLQKGRNAPPQTQRPRQIQNGQEKHETSVEKKERQEPASIAVPDGNENGGPDENSRSTTVRRRATVTEAPEVRRMPPMPSRPPPPLPKEKAPTLPSSIDLEILRACLEEIGKGGGSKSTDA